MSISQRPTIGFIGLGRVGSSLTIYWDNLGYNIPCVYSRNHANALKVSQLITTAISSSIQEVIRCCDIVFLSVSDNAIESVATELCSLDALDSTYFVHTSGAHTLESFGALKEKARGVGSLHPAYPFAHQYDTSLDLTGVTFAIEASNSDLENHLKNLALRSKGHPIVLTPDKKRLYHAAMVFTSNYTVTLFSVGMTILKTLEIDDTIAMSTLATLLKSTVNNLADVGLPDALTGPLIRNDTETIQQHLNKLTDIDIELVKLYIQLGRATYPLLEAKNVDREHIESIFKSFES